MQFIVSLVGYSSAALILPDAGRKKVLGAFFSLMPPVVGWFLGLGYSYAHLPALCDRGLVILFYFFGSTCFQSAENGGWRLESKASVTHSDRGVEELGEAELCTHTQRWGNNVQVRLQAGFSVDYTGPWSPLLQAVTQVLQPNMKPCQLSTFLRFISVDNGPVGWCHLWIHV